MNKRNSNRLLELQSLRKTKARHDLDATQNIWLKTGQFEGEVDAFRDFPNSSRQLTASETSLDTGFEITHSSTLMLDGSSIPGSVLTEDSTCYALSTNVDIDSFAAGSPRRHAVQLASTTESAHGKNTKTHDPSLFLSNDGFQGLSTNHSPQFLTSTPQAQGTAISTSRFSTTDLLNFRIPETPASHESESLGKDYQIQLVELADVTDGTTAGFPAKLPKRSPSLVQRIYSTIFQVGEVSMSLVSGSSTVSWRSSWLSPAPRKTPLTDAEVSIWDRIIDETKLSDQISVQPDYYRDLTSQGTNDKSCSLDNRLHRVAAAALPLRFILEEVELVPRELSLTNAFRDTFMHVLNTSEFGTDGTSTAYDDYITLLKFIKSKGFQFTGQDCHGRTIAHIAFKDKRLFGRQGFDGEQFSITTSLLGIDLSTRDNQGVSAGQRIALHADQGTLMGRDERQLLDFIVEKYSSHGEAHNTSYRELMSAAPSSRSFWANSPTGIDIQGNTAPIALLKWSKWPEKETASTLAILCCKEKDLEARDKRGRTALCIAAMKGARKCVILLLKFGALPNSRDYAGNSIVKLATLGSFGRKNGLDSKRYARVVDCIGRLSDCGGLMDPCALEEWQAPSDFEYRFEPVSELKKLLLRDAELLHESNTGLLLREIYKGLKSS
ncbi:hypothetical protein BJ875DRAFT_538739 [Amylocarpus encephaloides]|uniref:Ankyrin repeat protein n=1 Tax=Amylocarpus encephaloides TaxID=45428 RepID=A0A9P8CBT0_9HELO|nr:hypothetical protein BJ875DRAFT_538739 [Amylocarpus encephaloides]